MSRLDRHVAMVQNKLAVGRFVHALAWASVAFAAAVWIAIVIDRVFRLRPPHHWIWIWSGAGLCVLTSLMYALIRRPSRHDAAVAIDDRLALKEKFSTALYARPSKDPFAQAVVRDAEQTADNVSLHRRFPLEFPRQSLGTAGIAVLVILTLAFLPEMDLFGKEAQRKTDLAKQQDSAAARKQVEKALEVIVQAQAKGVADEETIKQAKKELQAMLNAPIRDTEKTKRTAARALADLDQTIKQQIANNQRVADAENDSKAFKSLTPPTDEKGPVADASRQLAKGNFAEAVEELEKAIDKFDKMEAKEQEKAAEQMKQMAAQLQQMAQNPQVQQQIQQQMQQMGMNQQQAQQAAQLMQQAAQGNKQAQQQLQQQAQQAMQQMNPQQQAAAKQMMQQMQAKANNQQQAQQMAQAAQQMAQAMQQQAAQQQAGQGGQKGQQQGAPQAGQQMAQGMQNMQQQLQQMQAMKADAQQVAAAQNAAAAAAADAANAMNGNGNQPGQQQANAGQNQGQGQGQWNNQNGKWNGQPNQGRGGGQAAGDRTYKEQAPFTPKQEISHSEDIEGGKILASTSIKAQSLRGDSKITAENVAPPPEQDAADEIEDDHINGTAKQAVKEYFSAWQKDAGQQPQPAQPQPAQK